VGKTPMKLTDVLIGEHQLKIELEGHATLLRKITLKENEVLHIDEQLNNSKSVTIECEPVGALLNLNGVQVGSAPKTLTLPFGTNIIHIESPGFVPHDGILEVTEKQDVYKFALLSDRAAKIRLEHTKFKTRKLISFATSVTFATIGTYFWVQSKKHSDEYKTATSEATQLHNTIEQERTLAQVSYGLSAACLTASWVFHRLQKKADKQLQIIVKMASGTASAGVVYNF
jgi:hypothetical protein